MTNAERSKRYRDKKAGNGSWRVSIRVSAETRRALYEAAEINGRSVSHQAVLWLEFGRREENRQFLQDAMRSVKEDECQS